METNNLSIMRARKVKEVVDELIGKIDPIASSEYDTECLNNISEYIKLCDKMIFDLSHISARCKDSSCSSIANVGLKATSFLIDLRDSLIEDLK